MDNKNFAIGILSTTAVILLVGLLIVSVLETPATASGMSVTSGNSEYTMTIGSMRMADDEEWLYLIDQTTMKMIAYRFNGRTRQIEIIQPFPLDEMRKNSEPSQP